MPRVSVIIPTHEHAATLPLAVASVQAQAIDDIEILICGDGATDGVRAAAVKIVAADPRIRFFDLPKAPRLGELNRDLVLHQAKGRIVCYQSDDDLWLAGHIEALEQALENADFAGAMQVNVDVDGRVRGHFFDLERPEFVEPWLDWRPNDLGSWACNGFGLSFAAHRLDAYKRLPQGWATTPVGLPTDQTMWHKFLRQEGCRAKFLRWPVALHFPAGDRKGWPDERRVAELQAWSEIVRDRDGMTRICRDLLPELGDRLLLQALDEREARRRREADLAREAAASAQALSALNAERVARRRAEDALLAERTVRAQAETKRDSVLASSSWRITAPLRAAIRTLKRLKFPRDA